MFNVKKIIKWERFRGKSFSMMDSSNTDDIMALLYVQFCNDPYTYEEFVEGLSDKLFKKLSGKLSAITRVYAQFCKTNIANEEGEGEPPTIEHVVESLIASGMDANFLLTAATLDDLPILINAAETKKKEYLTNCRLWTFFNIRPHLGKGTTIKQPEDLFPFPWEASEREAKAKKIMEENIQAFEAFMQGKFNNVIRN